ncbi:MAG: hypothetical protein AVDCRST_MAG40-379, partial [uncultured Gemmatimonadaceae bacterium]
CAPPSTSPPCRACAATPRSARSTAGSSRPASRGRRRSPRPRTSCSPSSTRWPARAPPGARRRPQHL